MIGVMTAGALIGGGLSAFGIGASNKQAVANYKAQVKALTLNYNYGLTNLSRQGRSLYEETVAHLFDMSLNSMKNQSMVEAAQAESGVEGRSSEKVMQDVVATDERTKTNVKDNFNRQAENLRNEAQSLYITTKSQMEAAYSQAKGATTSGFGSVLKIASGALSGALMGATVGKTVSEMMSGSTTEIVAQPAISKGVQQATLQTTNKITQQGLGYAARAGDLKIPTANLSQLNYNKARF